MWLTAHLRRYFKHGWQTKGAGVDWELFKFSQRIVHTVKD